MTFSKDEIEGKVKASLRKLRKHDKYLLDNNLNERTITYKLATYIQEEFQDFNVDCEYNRFDDLVKRIEVPKYNVNWDDTEARTIFPDIIVHKRGTQENNLLVIEIKKSSNSDSGIIDRMKLKALIKYPYNYKFGLFLRIKIDDIDDSLEWFPKKK